MLKETNSLSISITIILIPSLTYFPFVTISLSITFNNWVIFLCTKIPCPIDWLQKVEYSSHTCFFFFFHLFYLLNATQRKKLDKNKENRIDEVKIDLLMMRHHLIRFTINWLIPDHITVCCSTFFFQTDFILLKSFFFQTSLFWFRLVLAQLSLKVILIIPLHPFFNGSIY